MILPSQLDECLVGHYQLDEPATSFVNMSHTLSFAFYFTCSPNRAVTILLNPAQDGRSDDRFDSTTFCNY